MSPLLLYALQSAIGTSHAGRVAEVLPLETPVVLAAPGRVFIGGGCCLGIVTILGPHNGGRFADADHRVAATFPWLVGELVCGKSLLPCHAVGFICTAVRGQCNVT